MPTIFPREEKAEALFSNLKNSEQLVYITNGLVACNDSVDYIFHTAAPTTSKFFVKGTCR